MEDIGLRATLQGANAYISDAKKIQQETGKMGNQMVATAKDSQKASSSLVGSLKGVAVAFAGAFVATKVVSGIGDSIKAASDLSETVNKAQVVFGEASAAVLKFGDDAAQALGQSKNEAIGAAAAIGNLFLTTGLGQREAADMSMSIVQLASDLASFNNIDPTVALDKLRSGLVGEAEPLRTLGVLLSEEEVSLKAVQLGLAASTKEVTQAAKVQARYALIMEQTTTAQGDFARTSKGLANSQRILSAAWKDIQAQIGAALLPTIASLTSALATGLPKAFKAVQGATDRFLAVIKPVVSAIGNLWKRLSESSRFQSVVHLLRGLAESIAGIASALTRGDIGGALNRLWSSIRNWLVPLGSNIIGALGDISGAIVRWLGDQWAKVDWKAVWKTAKDVASGLKDVALDVGAWLGDKWKAVKWAEVWKKAGDIATGLVALTLDVGKWLGERWAEIKWADVWKMAGDIARGLGQFALDVTGWLGEQWGKVRWADVWKTAGDIWSGITTAGSKVTDWLGKEWAKINWTDVWANVTNIFATGLTYAQKAADWLGDTWAAIDWSAVWGAVTNLFRGIADIAEDVQAWLGEQWAKINWGAIWQAASGVMGDLIGAGVDIVDGLNRWLADQIGKVDPKKIYAGLPKPVGIDLPKGKEEDKNALQDFFDLITGIFDSAGKAISAAGRVAGLLIAQGFGFILTALKDGVRGARTWLTSDEGGKGIEVDWKAVWAFIQGAQGISLAGLVNTGFNLFFENVGQGIKANKHLILDPLRELIGEVVALIFTLNQKLREAGAAEQILRAKQAALQAQAGRLGGHPVEGMAEGGTTARAGVFEVGERGRELVFLPRAATVVPANMTRQIMNQQRTFQDTWNIQTGANPLDVAAIVRREIHFARIRQGR